MNKKHFLIIPLIGIMVGISYLSYSFINHAQAAGFTVNSLLDTSDIAPGDSSCDDGAGNCTLRAAIEEVNALGGSGHTIDFNVAGTISTSGFLNIAAGVTIDATTAPGASCDFATRNLPVVVDGGVNNIFIANTSDVTIKGLTLQTSNGAIGSVGGNNISVLCNNIGTDQTGLSDSPVAGNTGINFQGVTNSTIGQAGMGNVIANQTYRGIYIINASDTISIQGNHIGVNALGNASLSNHLSSGIQIVDSSNISIGNIGAGNENVISGFDGDIGSSEGIVITGGTHITIKNNYIGTDSTGTLAIPNGQQGIEVCGAFTCGGGNPSTTDLVIGGPNPGEGNVISGNLGDGVTLASVIDLIIQGNKMGTDITGSNALPNTGKGIDLRESSGAIIGGSNPGEGNILSNNDMGISVDTSTNVVITKNTIGFFADGITAAGNSTFGIFVVGSDDIHVGSSNNADRNYIGNSGFAGIILVNSGTNITVIKNNIGVGSDDATAGPNAIGIASFNTGSGSALIQENKIMNSLSDGVLIVNSSVFGPIPPTSGSVSVIKNNILNNGGLGINLAQDFDGDFVFEDGTSVNLNDISDSDTGPNNYLNYPALYTITPNGANYDVTYSVDVPNSGTPGVSGYYHVEFFKNTSADGTAHGEGETYIGFQNINVNPLLGVPYYGTYLTSVPLVAGDVISSTITECTDATCATFRSTSEFGSDATVLGGTTALDYGSAPDTGLPRSATSYPTYTISNGAYHIIDPTTYLGNCIDADSGTVIPFATSPLTIGACTNDNDGVTFPSSMLFGSTHVIPVTTHGAGVLNVWVDWNQNGDFENSERITTHAVMVNGANTFSLTIPAGVGTKTTYARIRFTSDASKVQQSGGVPSPYGEALDGEVEDYVLNLSDGVVVIPVTPPTPSGGGSSSSGIIATCRDPKASNYQTVGTHNPLLCTYSSTPVTQPKTTTLLNTGTPTTLDQKACPYFTQYLKSGAKNSKAEVTKWQHFLNEILGLKLKVNGIYDKVTVNAVNQFQLLFASDILTPWGLKKPTGYTYKTTRMKANQMVNCLESSVTLEGSGKTWVLPALK